MNITTRFAEPRDAQLFVELAERAFAHVPEHARPKDRPDFVAHTHGAANPAGRALVTLAQSEGRLVGHVSAIPFRFLRRDGNAATGWQIGCYVVDGSQQRQGIGQAILSDLQQAVARDERHGFLFGFPNRRSLGPLLRLGGREVARARTLFVAPTRSGHPALKDTQGREWFAMPADAEMARNALAHSPLAEATSAAFVRDAAFFHWRYLTEPAAVRYQFALVAPRGGGEVLLLVLSEHRARGLRFTVLVDVLPQVREERLALAVRAARTVRHGRPVYLTTNLRWTGAPFSFALPRSLDPRPVVDVLMPGSETLAAELEQAPILTGDWMGF